MPCGTPDTTGAQSDLTPSTTTTSVGQERTDFAIGCLLFSEMCNVFGFSGQGPDAQSIVNQTTSLRRQTTSLRRQLVKYISICQLNYQIHCWFLLKKCENLLQCKRFSHFSNKNNSGFVIFTF